MSPKAKVSKRNPKRQQIRGTNISPLTIFKPGTGQLTNPNWSTHQPKPVNSPTRTGQLSNPNWPTLQSKLANSPIQTCQLANPNWSTRQPKPDNSPIRICQFFGVIFNIMSAFFVHQPLTLPQKIDSREGLFWCQKGVVVHADKMNFYLSQPPLTPVLGLFAAKYSAFWC